jgi:hypothetical protein
MKNLAKIENLKEIGDKMDYQFDPILVDSSAIDVPAGFKVRPLVASDFDHGTFRCLWIGKLLLCR